VPLRDVLGEVYEMYYSRRMETVVKGLTHLHTCAHHAENKKDEERNALKEQLSNEINVFFELRTSPHGCLFH
jgi:hypothetical protein